MNNKDQFPPSPDPFLKLTWEDLEDWAGPGIVNRGRSYQSGGNVRDLARTGDDALVAWVLGSQRYATRAHLRAREFLESECTCPYGPNCKHAVAVVLEYLERVKAETGTDVSVEDDQRLALLSAREGADECGEPWEIEAFEGHEEYETVRQEADASEEKSKEKRSGSAEYGASSLAAYLEEQTKPELVALLVEFASAYEEVRRTLLDRQRVTSGRTGELLRMIRREIAALQEPVWDRYEYGTPVMDSSRLEMTLKALIRAGQADAAARIGPELLEAGSRAMEYVDDEEAGDGFSACLEVLFANLDATSLAPADQIMWALDMDLADGYDLCGAGVAGFLERAYAARDWSTAADRLAKRLEAGGFASNDDEDDEGDGEEMDGYERNRVSNWLIHALEEAGRSNEIIPLCEREAPVTLSYVRLVDRLIGDSRWEEARNWCRKGISAVSSHKGTAAALRERLRTINTRTGDPIAGLAIQAEEFFADPGRAAFQSLCETARGLGTGPGVEIWARHFLETGRRPGSQRKGQGAPKEDWPLPAPEVEVRARRSEAEAPMTRILIELAIAEEKPAEVLKWYDRAENAGGSVGGYAHGLLGRVAEAVSLAYPDRSIAIWKGIAEGEIAQVVARGYDAAVPHLRKVKNTLNRTGRNQEWKEYLASLRERNRRRPRCLQALARLETDRPIVEDRTRS